MPERHPVVRQVYVVGAVLAFVGTFMPLFATEDGGGTYATMNLWTAVTEDGGGAAAVGVVVVLAMVATAAHATRPARSFGAPGGILFLAFVSVVMLVTRPGAGSDASLGAGGGLLLGAALVLAAAALYDALGTSRADAPPIVLP